MKLPRLATAANWFAYATRFTPNDVLDVILHDARDLRDAGFVGVELPIPLLGGCLADLSRAFWTDVGGRLRDLGLEPISVHGPNWPSLDADVRETVAMLSLYADAANALGVHALVAHPTAHSHPHVCTVVPQLLARDRELALAVSERLGDGPAKLAIENLPTYGLRYLDELIAHLPQSNIGVCFDTGHFQVRPEGNLADVVRRLSPRLVHLHLTDNNGLCDQHLPPGQGIVDWPTFFSALPTSWRQKTLLIELGAPHLLSHPNAAMLSGLFHRAACEQATRCFEEVFKCLGGPV